MIRLVLVEDHAMVREAMVRWLEGKPDLSVVATTDRGDDVVALVEEHAPDVVLLDIGLPGDDGITVGVRLRSVAPSLRIVYLTMHDDDATIRDVLRVGAQGYVVKSDPPDEVVAAVRAVAAGGRYVSDRIARRLERVRHQGAPGLPPGTASRVAGTATPPVRALGDVENDVVDLADHLEGMVGSPSQRRELQAVLAERRNRLAELRAPFDQLTPREEVVLAGLVRGLSAPCIADEAMVSAATVRTQIRSILLKLGVHSQLAAVSLARRARWHDEVSVEDVVGTPQ